MKTCFLLGVMVGAISTSAMAASTVEKGRALYMKVGCYQCHGTVGQGGVAGPRLAPEPMTWDAFAQFVHNSADAMPAYRKNVLPSADLKTIHDYLSSLPPPPAVDEIPLLRGKK